MINLNEFTELLLNRYTNEQLAAHFNCSTTTIKRFKKNNNLVGIATNSKPLNICEVEQVKRLIDEEFSLHQIVAETALTPHRIRKYLPSEYLKALEKNNNNFQSNSNRIGTLSRFNEPTNYTSYMIGLLQADGSITDTGVVSITSKDLQIVENFSDFTNCNVVKDKNGYFNGQVKDYKLTEKFKQVSNIVPRKTYSNYTIPEWIVSNIEFFTYFLSGVFDGDGTVFNKRDNELTLAIEQHISQETYLLQLNKFLDWKPYNYTNSFRIQTSNSNTIKKFAAYYLANPYALKRKKEKLESRCKI